MLARRTVGLVGQSAKRDSVRGAFFVASFSCFALVLYPDKPPVLQDNSTRSFRNCFRGYTPQVLRFLFSPTTCLKAT